MVTWLKVIGAIPKDVEWKRGNRHPNTNLKPDAIPAGYLAEVAHDWDTEGRTTPREFVDALAFEIAGTRERNSVIALYDEMMFDNMAWANS